MLERQGRSGAAIQQKNFDAPDDVRRFPKGIVTLVRVGSVTIGRGILEPGFRWSTSLKPIQGTPSCQIHHLQLLVQGRFHVEMDDGETAEIVPGDIFDVPPGHDVWVGERHAALSWYSGVRAAVLTTCQPGRMIPPWMQSSTPRREMDSPTSSMPRLRTPRRGSRDAGRARRF
jgi:hypothetical protein